MIDFAPNHNNQQFQIISIKNFPQNPYNGHNQRPTDNHAPQRVPDPNAIRRQVTPKPPSKPPKNCLKIFFPLIIKIRWIPGTARFCLLGQTPRMEGHLGIYQLSEDKIKEISTVIFLGFSK